MSPQRGKGSFTARVLAARDPWSPFILCESVETTYFPLPVCFVEHLAQAGVQYTRHQAPHTRHHGDTKVLRPRGAHCASFTRER